MNGTLALVGSGEYLPAMEPVDRLLLGRVSGGARVVCLPTAAGTEGAERIGYWSRLGVEHFTRLGTQVAAVLVIDRASAEDEALAARIRAANFVYLSGGKPGYLYETLAGTRAWTAIQHVLDDGGVVAGCSAGAMIFGAGVPPFFARGFNILPEVTIVPHYDEMSPRLAWLVKAVLARGSTLLGIEGNTALVRYDNACRAAGTGGVTVWSRRLKKRYTNGETVEWP